MQYFDIDILHLMREYYNGWSHYQTEQFSVVVCALFSSNKIYVFNLTQSHFFEELYSNVRSRISW
jgi:hypothetical protein